MSDFLYREPAKIIRDILIEELDLEQEQVLLSNQKYDIPSAGLFIVLSYLTPAKVISRKSELVDDGDGGMLEVSSATLLDAIQIQVMAYNEPEGGNEARTRNHEVVMALASIFSQQTQEKYAMQIARDPSPFQDTSFLEETEMMTRYTGVVMTTSVSQKQKATNQYYNTFPGAALYPDSVNTIIPILAPPVNPLTA